MGDSSVVSWTVNDERVDLDLLDVSGTEWRDAKMAAGYQSQGVLLQEALVGRDLGAIAALLWVALRRADPTIEYDGVLASLSIRAMQPAEAAGG